MVVSGRINRVGFYARMNYTRRNYSQYLPIAEESGQGTIYQAKGRN